MAASTAHASRGLDPRRSAKYTVHLSDALLRPLSTPSNLSTIQFNTKPSQTTDTRHTQIGGSDRHGATTLSIRDDEPEGPKLYEYNGARTEAKGTYVLIFDDATHAATLEPLNSAYTFNLTSAPWENNPHRLAREYPQVHPPKATGEGSDDEDADLFEDEDEDGNEEADAANPFDFRHFLQGSGSSPSPPHGPSAVSSAVNTPLRVVESTSTSSKKPAAARRAEPAKPSVKKEAAAPRAPPASRKRKSPSPPPPPPAPAQPSVPDIRVDRRASTRETPAGRKKPVKKPEPAPKQEALALPTKAASPPPPSSPAARDDADYADDAEYEDDEDMAVEETGGGLTIDFGDAEDPRVSRRRAFGLDLGDSNGPISLHSAANSASPASRQYTPHYGKTEDEPFNMEFESPTGHDDEEEDGDVDVIELGPPAHQNSDNQDGDEDMDADFEAELMQEFEHADDDDQGQVHHQSESDESEEE
jgi:hypothetical protein